jgi:hypothetical protein
MVGKGDEEEWGGAPPPPSRRKGAKRNERRQCGDELLSGQVQPPDRN